MGRKHSVRGWPFDPEQVMICHWLGSPRRGEKNLIRLPAVFRSEHDGQLHELDFPWALVSWLRLGSRYRAGSLSPLGSSGQVGEIDIGLSPKIDDIEAVNCIPKLLHRLAFPWAFRERCWKVETEQQTFVIPTQLLLSRVLAQHKFILNAVHKPRWLDMFVRHALIHEKRVLYVSFDKQIPLRLATQKSFVKAVARLFYDPSFSRCWNEIQVLYGEALADAKPFPPLRFGFPALAPRMKVRYVSQNRTTLVLDILSVGVANWLPFDTIYFDHPKLKRSGTGQGSLGVVEVNSPEELLIDTAPGPSRPGSDVRLIPVLDPKIIQDGQKILILPERVLGSPGSRLKVNLEPGSTLVSLAEPQPGGQIQGAEFNRGLGGAADDETPDADHLEDFWKALNVIADEGEVEVGVETYKPPRSTGFVRRVWPYRRCAVATLTWPDDQWCAVLEFERPDGHSISTLVFVAEDREGLEGTVARLLEKGLRTSGSWDVGETRSLLGGVMFLKHKDDEPPEDWAGRILAAADFLLDDVGSTAVR